MIPTQNAFLRQALEATNLIKQQAPASERMGELHPEQLRIIYERNWFNLFVPRSLGGMEMPLPDALRLLELLARADASFGWTVTLCSGANWFAGFLEDNLANALFEDKQVCFAGSGAVSGTATITPTGYSVSGDWNYATGAPHATVFTANCRLEKDGKPILREDGSAMVKTFVFKRNDVEIRKTWNTLGMKATASHSFSAKALDLPFNSAFVIQPENATLPGLIFRLPFQSFAELTLTANFSGIAIHFLEECRVIYEARIKRQVYAINETCEMLELLGRTTSKLEGTQLIFFDFVEQSWQRGISDGQWNQKDLEKLKQICRELVKQCRQTVNDLFPYCGMIAADPDSEINRIWRDFQTASLHSLFTFGCG